ncbi:Mitogen-activated protein kinase kinase kinase 1a, partial [Bulinus truncatus]
MQESTSDIVSLAPQIPRNWQKGDELSRNVHLVKDPSYPLDRKFIVKEIHTKESNKDRPSKAYELEILRNVNDFRIVRFYGSIQKPKQLLIFMEYIEKGTLSNHIQETNKHGLDIEEVRVFSRQILEGVSYLHNYQPQIIHRDIKGTNILLQDRRNIKLTDFGVSKMITSNSCARTGVGTFNWMAPEVVNSSNGGSYDFKADIWSIGCTVVEMATGGPIFPHLSNVDALLKIGDGVPPEYDLPDNSPIELKDFLDIMFKKNPSERPTSDELIGHRFMKEIRLSSKIAHENLTKGTEIGSGTFGEVYLATDTGANMFALKEMKIRPADREVIM